MTRSIPHFCLSHQCNDYAEFGGDYIYYNHWRWYSPTVGRYNTVDPLSHIIVLYPLTLELGEGNISFMNIAIYCEVVLWQRNTVPFPYAFNNTLSNDDKVGLGWLGCLWYSWKLSKYRDMCRKELEVCNSSPECLCDFADKYGANDIDLALYNCACWKGGENLCAKWLTSCYGAAWRLPPKPSR